jgi:hypothetical protein
MKKGFFFSLLSYWEMKGFEGCGGEGGIEHERLGNNFLHSVVWPERGFRREGGPAMVLPFVSTDNAILDLWSGAYFS